MGLNNLKTGLLGLVMSGVASGAVADDAPKADDALLNHPANYFDVSLNDVPMRRGINLLIRDAGKIETVEDCMRVGDLINDKLQEGGEKYDVGFAKSNTRALKGNPEYTYTIECKDGGNVVGLITGGKNKAPELRDPNAAPAATLEPGA